MSFFSLTHSRVSSFTKTFSWVSRDLVLNLVFFFSFLLSDFVLSVKSFSHRWLLETPLSGFLFTCPSFSLTCAHHTKLLNMEHSRTQTWHLDCLFCSYSLPRWSYLVVSVSGNDNPLILSRLILDMQGFPEFLMFGKYLSYLFKTDFLSIHECLVVVLLLVLKKKGESTCHPWLSHTSSLSSNLIDSITIIQNLNYLCFHLVQTTVLSYGRLMASYGRL